MCIYYWTRFTQNECLSVSHKERLTLDMTKRRVCYEIVTRSSVVIRATVSTARRARFAALHFPVAFLGNPPRLYYARIGNVPEKPGLAGSRKRRVTERTWDARGLSRPFRPVRRDQKGWIGLPARRSPDKEDKGPVLGAPPRRSSREEPTAALQDARNDVYVHA